MLFVRDFNLHPDDMNFSYVISMYYNSHPKVAMLNKSQIIDLLRSNKEEFARRFSVRQIGIFGSITRGEEHAGSDIDILVDFERSTFDNYMDLKFHLESLLGGDVDLVLMNSVKPRLKPIISREVVFA